MTLDDAHKLSSRDLTTLFAAAALLQGALYGLVPFPGDYDQAYYLSVARHIVSGDGASIGAVWNYTFVPDRLPHAADVHWMPLPSRILVPGEALYDGGHRIVGALLAGLWAPLAALLAQELNLNRRWALGAGAAAVLGGGWAARIAAPDTYGLVGVLGGLALLFAARRQAVAVGVLACAIALSRTDGALFALALALALPGRAALAPLVGGFLGTAGWSLRNHLLFGEAYWTSRSAATAHTDYFAWASGLEAAPLGPLDRIALLGTHSVDMLAHWLMSGMIVGTALALLGVAKTRDTPWVRGVAAYWLCLPIIATVLAPAIAWHGTVFRSTTAIAPALCALGALGLLQLNQGLAKSRDLHPALLPTLGLGCFAVLSALTGAQAILLQAREADPCEPLAHLPQDEVVFAYDALYIELRCDRPAVTLFGNTTPDQRDALAQQYGIRHALTSPPTSVSDPTQDLGPLSGWVRDGRLFTAPERAR